ncbi:MAG: hypothetical protein CSB06_01300 [Bacteroidia bacterium]|nr:MAG: hypothetical protein CSB06_01300 [Bacteroidia bacterium]
MKNIRILLVLILLSACGEEEVTRQPQAPLPDPSKQSLLKANQFLPQKDQEKIETFIQRKGWDMQKNASGVYEQIFRDPKNNKKKVSKGNTVHYAYKIFLLDGTLCYSSDQSGLASLKVGEAGKETALEEVILRMHKGEKARIIIPPYRAHGLIGDMKKIPARSSVIYEIELTEIIDF